MIINSDLVSEALISLRSGKNTKVTFFYITSVMLPKVAAIAVKTDKKIEFFSVEK